MCTISSLRRAKYKQAAITITNIVMFSSLAIPKAVVSSKLMMRNSSCLLTPAAVVVARHISSIRCISTAVTKMHSLFNSQITKEMNASQLYLSASIWCDEQEYTGMAAFMRLESSEERTHALEMVDFALKRDFPVELEALQAPHAHWETPEALWEDLVQAEKTNSESLYVLANAAQECQDHALTTFLMPFHTEQVDAVANMKTILAKIREESIAPGMIRQVDAKLSADAKEAEAGSAV